MFRAFLSLTALFQMKNSWRNGLATGLLVGVGLTVALLIWGNLAANTLRCILDQGCTQLGTPKPGQSPQNWSLVRRMVSAEDTFAQWLMSFTGLAALAVSAFAMYFIYRTLQVTQETLRATNEMAADTREIGKNQTRAHLFVESVEYYIDRTLDEADFTHIQIGFLADFTANSSVSATIKNLGNTSAKSVHWTASVKVFSDNFNTRLPVLEGTTRNCNSSVKKLPENVGQPLSPNENFTRTVDACLFISEEGYSSEFDASPCSTTSAEVVISLHYCDIFGDNHYEEYCFFGKVPSNGTGVLTPTCLPNSDEFPAWYVA